MTTLTANEMKTNTGHVMFENAGEADFYALFLVGFTDKANDPDKIGMFGSGFKLAMTSALRLKLKMSIYIGRDKVTIKTIKRDVKGTEVEQIVFVKTGPDGTSEEHTTNLTMGYGARDWKDSWGVYRELFANCRDADPRHYEVVYGVEPKGRPGFTRVFLEGTEEVLQIYRNADFYFREERHASFSCDCGRLYPKTAKEEETYYYCKGVYVLATKEASLFDIDLYHLPINESRNASTSDLYVRVLQLYDMCPPDVKADILRFAIETGDKGRRTLENSLYWRRSNRANAWAQAFKLAFPDTVLCSFSEVEYQAMIRMGRKVVRVSQNLYELLSRHGVETAQEILQSEQKGRKKIFQPAGEMAENYRRAFEKVARKLPEVHRLNISFIELPPGGQNVSFLTVSRHGGTYQFSDLLLRLGPKEIALALIDALSQTKSLNGRCHPHYEEQLMKMTYECLDDAA